MIAFAYVPTVQIQLGEYNPFSTASSQLTSTLLKTSLNVGQRLCDLALVAPHYPSLVLTASYFIPPTFTYEHFQT